MLEDNLDEMAARGRCSSRRARKISLLLIYLFVCIHQGHGIGFTSIYTTADHYWPMKNISDNTSLDKVGSVHASIQNGAEVNSTNLFGPAVILDGLDDFIVLDLPSEYCTNTPSKCNDGFTVSFWLYHTRGEFILCTGVYTNKNKGPGIKFIYDEGQGDFVLEISTVHYTWKLTTQIPRRTWVHVAFTWSRDQGTQMYLNGKVVPARSIKAKVEFERPRLNGGWTIGRPNEIFKLTNYGNFGISHLALWLRELTKVEVATAYVETTSRDRNKVIALINDIVNKQPSKNNETKNKTSKKAKNARSTASNMFTFGKHRFVQATLLVLCSYLL